MVDVIHDDPPMRDEIARGFYPAFEDRWRRAEVIGRWLMAAFIALNVLGLFGRGLFSEWTRANPDGSLAVDYEPVTRFGANSVVVLHTRVPPGGDRVAVTLSTELANLFGLETITPRPSAWEAGDTGIRLVFPVRPGEKTVMIRFAGTPNFRSRVALWARLDAGETVSWSQYSVP